MNDKALLRSHELYRYLAGWNEIATKTDSAANSKLFAKQMTQVARIDAVLTQGIPAGKAFTSMYG